MSNPLSKVPGSVWVGLGKALVQRITPGDSKKDLLAALAATTAERDAFAREAAYWRAKAEILTDQAMQRAGNVQRSVFVETPPGPVEQAVSSILGAAASIGRPTTPQKDE